ncbi:MAG TPA: hypothetical protein VEZ90_05800, partial [Blastocatellia bacterium]|nr:hypothetical protein [Blastocatellia bacterium]
LNMTYAYYGPLQIEGLPVLWLERSAKDQTIYRPAILVDLTLNFRSLRAELNHSEDRTYTTWVPAGELAIDWDSPAVESTEDFRFAAKADLSISYSSKSYPVSKTDFEQYRDELVAKLIRKERLQVYSNTVFGLFSSPGDQLEDFMYHVAEAALHRVEPELRLLRNKFDLQLEQMREAQARKGLNAENVSIDRLQLTNIRLAESENRLTSIFSTLAGSVFGTAEPRRPADEDEISAELQEDLGRMEREAREALRGLYDEYMKLAGEYDTFDIGLQPDNVQVLRLALLWVPVTAP